MRLLNAMKKEHADLGVAIRVLESRYHAGNETETTAKRIASAVYGSKKTKIKVKGRDALGRRRRKISKEGRANMSKGMRAFWAKKKADEKKAQG